MKRVKIAIVSLTIALLLSTTGYALGLKLNTKVQAAELTIGTELKENYLLDDWFDVPDGIIVVNGSEFPATASVRLPNGEMTRQQGFYLNFSGKYQIIYTAKVNGKTYVKQREIVVNDSADAEKAKITLDLAGYSRAALPSAEVGKPYKLFDATATVGKTKAEVVKDVYLLYGEHSSLKVETIDDYFTPERSGTYEIRYVAENFYGEKTQTVLTVNAVSDAVELGIESKATAIGVAGEAVHFDTPVMTTDDRMGKTILTVKAQIGEREESLYDGLYSEANNLGYVFDAVGEWQIKWILSDYSRAITTTSEIDVTAPDPVFVGADSKAIEPVFFTGRTYKLSDILVKSYDETGVRYEKSDVTVNYDDGETIAVSDGVFTVKDTATSVIVRWTKGSLEKAETIPVKKLVTEDGIDTSALFAVKNDRLDVGESGVIFDFTKHKNKDVTFANKAYVGSLAIMLDATSLKVGKNFEISLIDPENTDNKVVVKFSLSGTGLTVTNNIESGSKTVSVGSSGKIENINVLYSDTTKTLAVNNGESGDKSEAKIVLTSFQGFTSSEAFIVFKTSSSNAELVISRINGQRLNKISKDANLPQLIRKGSYLPEASIGEEIELFTAYGIDSLDGYCLAKINVKNNETGEYLKSTDGTVLNGVDASVPYKIKVTARMRIRIQYTSEDLSGNETSEVMYITAIGGVAPELTVGKSTQTVAKQGDELILPEIGTVHPLDIKTEVFVVVYDPDGKGTIAENGKYTFTKKGSHKILITACDEEGNSSEYYYYTEVV